MLTLRRLFTHKAVAHTTCTSIVFLHSSVVAGIGEMDLRWSEEASPTHSPPPPPPSTCPYLLLDVRDREDYEHCHIITGGCMQQAHNLQEEFHFCLRVEYGLCTVNEMIYLVL